MNILFLVTVLGSSTLTAVEQAEDAYRRGLETRDRATVARGHFREAAIQYDLAWEDTNRSPGLARHRAQAWFLAGDTGRSILAYRDGLKLFPEDQALLSGLRFTREQVILPPMADLADACRPMPPPVSQQAIPPMAFFLVFVAMSIAGGGLLLQWLSRRRIESLFAGLIFSTLAWGGVWTWHSTQEQHADHWAKPVAVLTEPAFLRTGNNAEFPKRFDQPIPAGVETTPLEERGGWLYVRLPGGQPGWLPLTAIARTHPPETPRP
ncbi:SH3 domain-containing protein [Zavarzinella formosa]|uniref:hypothetical protein n=1 Tax=Zavarzinella formosa TaxID=360055 RepID=UPI000316EE25|nr:hypothetical protein [Zavarzinella formosa]